MNRKFTYLIFFCLALLFININFAQENTLFTIVQGDPIIVAGDGGDWSQPLHNAGAVIFHDGQFHMFRNGYPSLPGNSVIGYATSPDAINWTHHEENPILRTDDVPYAEMIMASSVIVQPDGTWVLYFLIWDTSETPGAIGRATASDPTGEWTIDDAPILTHGAEGTWDAAQVTQPSVLPNLNDNGYFMYYTGVDESGNEGIGLASSSDGIVWRKYDNRNTRAPLYSESDPILQHGDTGDWDSRSASRGRVVRSEDGYVMIYRTPAAGRGFVYGLAQSDDGFEWRKHSGNPILAGSDIAGAGSLFFPTFAYNNGIYYFFIEAFSGTSRIYLLTHEAPLNITIEENPMPTVRTLVEELPSGTGGLTIDADGNIYAANIGLAPAWQGTEIFRITPDGEFEIWVQDERLLGATGNTFDNDGNLIQSSFRNATILRISPDGDIEEITSEGIIRPVGVVVAPDDTLYVANCGGNSIQRVTIEGESSVFASGSSFSCPNGLTIDPNGNLYAVNFRNGNVVKVTSDGEASVFANVPGNNNGHILYHDGLLYVVARSDHSIYTLTLDGQLTLFAGTGERGHENGTALEATFNMPNDIIASPDGRFLYVNEFFIAGQNLPSVIRVIELP